MVRVSREEVRYLGPPPRELGARDLGVAHLVGDVVDLAAEGVERGDRAAPLGREEQEAVVEARAALGGFLLAVVVGVHRSIAFARILAQSHLPSTGRWRKTSPAAASILSRIAAPPWTVARISRPRRPGSAHASGSPESKSSRERAHSKAMSARHASSTSCRAIWSSRTPKRARSSCGR